MEELSNTVPEVVPAPPGIVMVAPPEIPRNAQTGKVQDALQSKRLEQSP